MKQTEWVYLYFLMLVLWMRALCDFKRKENDRENERDREKLKYKVKEKGK